MPRFFGVVCLHFAVSLIAVHSSEASVLMPWGNLRDNHFPVPSLSNAHSTVSLLDTQKRLLHILRRDSLLPPDLIERMSHLIEQESVRLSLDPFLILAIISTESRFKAEVVSVRGATGFMQLMPPTKQWLFQHYPDLKKAYEEGAESPELLNIRMGIRYVSALFRMFKTTEDVLFAYNCGPDCVRKAQREEDPLPEETSYYAVKVFRNYQRFNAVRVAQADAQ